MPGIWSPQNLDNSGDSIFEDLNNSHSEEVASLIPKYYELQWSQKDQLVSPDAENL